MLVSEMRLLPLEVIAVSAVGLDGSKMIVLHWVFVATAPVGAGNSAAVETSPCTATYAISTSPSCRLAGFVIAMLVVAELAFCAAERYTGSGPAFSRYRSAVAVPAFSVWPAVN